MYIQYSTYVHVLESKACASGIFNIRRITSLMYCVCVDAWMRGCVTSYCWMRGCVVKGEIEEGWPSMGLLLCMYVQYT